MKNITGLNCIKLDNETKKRKPTAYNIFMKKTMKKVKTANPGVKQQDIMRMAAQLWRLRKRN